MYVDESSFESPQTPVNPMQVCLSFHSIRLYG